jgi:hypothetical protein
VKALSGPPNGRVSKYSTCIYMREMVKCWKRTEGETRDRGEGEMEEMGQVAMELTKRLQCRKPRGILLGQVEKLGLVVVQPYRSPHGPVHHPCHVVSRHSDRVRGRELA